MRGLTNYARPGKPWVFRHLVSPIARTIHDFGVRGVVAFVPHTGLFRELRSARVPFVNVSGMLPLPAHTVCTDNHAVGATAADYFMRLGRRHLAYVGYCGRFQNLRERGCAEYAARHGATFRSFHDIPRSSVIHNGTWHDEVTPAFLAWLRALPKPTGILCIDDGTAVILTELCRSLDIAVPEEVALVGVDNNADCCEMGWPPVSSVDLGGEWIGYEAAQILDRLLAGMPVAPDPLLVPPAGVVTRGSSRILGIEDARVAAAIRLIHDHIGDGIGPRDVLEQVRVSRRTFERLFREVTGTSLLEYIQRLRVERTKKLLAETTCPVERIAFQAGFGSSAQMRVIFRRHEGMSAFAYRKKNRHGSSRGNR